jgi:hypothetical protein
LRRVPTEGEEHEGNGDEEADAEGMHERPAVLLECGTVALDAVDPVDRPLDLAERGRCGHESADQAEPEREEAVLRPDVSRLLHGVREEIACETRHRTLDRVDDDAADLEAAERHREPAERDEALDETSEIAKASERA